MVRNFAGVVTLFLFLAAAHASPKVPSVFKIKGIVTPDTCLSPEGIVAQFRLTGCEGEPPCNVNAEEELTFETDFITSKTTEAVFRMQAIFGSSALPIVEASIGSLIEGIPYTVTQMVTISGSFRGNEVTMREEIYDQANGRIEVCLQLLLAVS